MVLTVWITDCLDDGLGQELGTILDDCELSMDWHCSLGTELHCWLGTSWHCCLGTVW